MPIEVDQQLRRSMEIINTLSRDRYPNLCRFFSVTGARAKLNELIDYMMQHPAPMWTSRAGERFYSFTRDYARATNGGTPEAWNNAIILLRLFKLLKFMKPNASSHAPIMRQLYAEAQDRNRAAEVLYFVPEYTPDLLAEAEALCAEWNSTGAKYSGITRQIVAVVMGEAEATRAYGVPVRISSHTERVLRDLVFRIVKTIETQGYAEKDRILSAARVFERRYHPHARSKVTSMWKSLDHWILAEAQAELRRATPAQIAQYGLQGKRPWIILPDATWETDPPTITRSPAEREALPEIDNGNPF